MKSILIFLITLLLIDRGFAFRFAKGALKRTEQGSSENVTNKSFSRILGKFMKHFQKNPEEAFSFMRQNMEIRKNMDNAMKKKVQQMEFKNFWELRRG